MGIDGSSLSTEWKCFTLFLCFSLFYVFSDALICFRSQRAAAGQDGTRKFEYFLLLNYEM